MINNNGAHIIYTSQSVTRNANKHIPVHNKNDRLITFIYANKQVHTDKAKKQRVF